MAGYGQTSDNTYATANIIVAPTLAEGANYTTIAEALTAASSGDTIFVKPGTYTEDITTRGPTFTIRKLLKSTILLISISMFAMRYLN